MDNTNSYVVIKIRGNADVIGNLLSSDWLFYSTTTTDLEGKECGSGFSNRDVGKRCLTCKSPLKRSDQSQNSNQRVVQFNVKLLWCESRRSSISADIKDRYDTKRIRHRTLQSPELKFLNRLNPTKLTGFRV